MLNHMISYSIKSIQIRDKLMSNMMLLLNKKNNDMKSIDLLDILLQAL